MPSALINGITGQDGRYLAKLLLSKGYDVLGLSRNLKLKNLAFQENQIVEIFFWDMYEQSNLDKILAIYKPDEIYNCAGYSGLNKFANPVDMIKINGLAITYFLESMRSNNLKIKFCQSSSSEIYGNPICSPQNEVTPKKSRNPYGASKIYADNMIQVYRENFGIFATSAILFNHESPVRGENFVTRKITRALSRIKLGIQDCLYLGNLDAKRDWGHAKDYMEAQWLMLQQEYPDDFVIATGVQYSVRDFVNLAAQELDIKIEWKGKGIDEKGFDEKGKCIVSIDPKYFRAAEVDTLLGDYSKAKKMLGWEPKISFQELVSEMITEDFKIAKKEQVF